MSGHNRGKIAKSAKASVVLSCGMFSGRSMCIKKGPGNPGKKGKKKSVWYEGPESREVTAGNFVSRPATYFVRLGSK